MMLEHGITDARELVGQGTGGLVVVGSALHLECPVFQAVDLPTGQPGHRRRSKHRVRPVVEQHPKIAVAALGDAPQTSGET